MQASISCGFPCSEVEDKRYGRKNEKGKRERKGEDTDRDRERISNKNLRGE